MKLSKQTVAILSNFSGINGNLYIEAGSVLKTLTAQKTLFAEAVVADKFPENFGIYDLSEFISVLGLFEEPELAFNDKFVTISGAGGRSVKFFSAEASVLVRPTKPLNFPTEVDVEFDLTADDLKTLLKTATILRTEDVSFIGDGQSVTMVVGDKKNETANCFEAVLGETDKTFQVRLKVSNLKMITDDYKVSFSKKRISRFVGQQATYFLALESDSTFG